MQLSAGKTNERHSTAALRRRRARPSFPTTRIRPCLAQQRTPAIAAGRVSPGGFSCLGSAEAALRGWMLVEGETKRLEKGIRGCGAWENGQGCNNRTGKCVNIARLMENVIDTLAFSIAPESVVPESQSWAINYVPSDCVPFYIELIEPPLANNTDCQHQTVIFNFPIPVFTPGQALLSREVTEQKASSPSHVASSCPSQSLHSRQAPMAAAEPRPGRATGKAGG
jgi:hypothetical protein